jgi:hypothetical protein
LNRAETLVRTLLAFGVNTCFANPGTSVVRVEVKSDQLVIELVNSKGANPKRKRSRNAVTLSKLVASIARGRLDR